MKVEYLDHCGDDMTVVNAARVSFAKEVHEMGKDDERLINYLATHKHYSPFNHCFASFRVQAPVFVARQLVKHEYLPWNEVSRRYVKDDPEFHHPMNWRAAASNVKQGSLPDRSDWQPHTMYEDIVVRATHLYREMIEAGVCPEQARMVLPQSMMTEWIWSGTLKAWAKMCKLRLDSHAQEETRVIARWINQDMGNLFPVSWSALMNSEVEG